ncbi:MAG: PQQ-binding-like beta-propeller repeat protein [Deinococcales bacterium]
MTLLERLTYRLIVAGVITATAFASADGTPQPTFTAFRANPQPVVAGTPPSYAWTLDGTSGPVTCTLDPGDGTPTINVPDCAQGPTTQHAYSAPGTYTATLDLPAAGLKTTTHVTVVKTLPANPKPGTLVWEYQTGFIYQSYLYSSPALARDGTIVFGSGDRHIYAINPNGTLKWHAPTNEVLDHAAAIAQNGTIYLAPLRHFEAFHPDGRLAWTFQDPTSTDFTLESAPVIGNDGTLYVTSTSGTLYAIHVTATGLANSAWPKFQNNNRNTGRAH